MKRILFGLAFVLALAVAPKAHAISCTGELAGDTAVQGTTVTYWESCNVGNGWNQWERVSWWEYEVDSAWFYHDDGD
jgi:hypothetical protein